MIEDLDWVLMSEIDASEALKIVNAAGEKVLYEGVHVLEVSTNGAAPPHAAEFEVTM